MEDGVPGMEKGTAQPVEEEATQDEDILTFEEFKQRRMMEVQLHQQEELKNSGMSNVSLCVLLECFVTELSSNGVARGSVSNNYASLECGAKVISTNKEANVSMFIPHVPWLLCLALLHRTLRLSYKRTEIFTC